MKHMTVQAGCNQNALLAYTGRETTDKKKLSPNLSTVAPTSREGNTEEDPAVCRVNNGCLEAATAIVTVPMMSEAFNCSHSSCYSVDDVCSLQLQPQQLLQLLRLTMSVAFNGKASIPVRWHTHCSGRWWRKLAHSICRQGTWCRPTAASIHCGTCDYIPAESTLSDS